MVLLATFPLGPFLRLHLLLGSWNSLLAHIGSIDTLSTFKRHLNFHLFQSACIPSSHPVPAPQIRSCDVWRHINLYVCMVYIVRTPSYHLRNFYTSHEQLGAGLRTAGISLSKTRTTCVLGENAWYVLDPLSEDIPGYAAVCARAKSR